MGKTWQEQFADDFWNKAFMGMSREENTRLAIEHFTKFIAREKEKSRKLGEQDMKRRALACIPNATDNLLYMARDDISAL